jgi:hypothetical protein
VSYLELKAALRGFSFLLDTLCIQKAMSEGHHLRGRHSVLEAKALEEIIQALSRASETEAGLTAAAQADAEEALQDRRSILPSS